MNKHELNNLLKYTLYAFGALSFALAAGLTVYLASVYAPVAAASTSTAAIGGFVYLGVMTAVAYGVGLVALGANRMLNIFNQRIIEEDNAQAVVKSVSNEMDDLNIATPIPEFELGKDISEKESNVAINESSTDAPHKNEGAKWSQKIERKSKSFSKEVTADLDKSELQTQLSVAR